MKRRHNLKVGERVKMQGSGFLGTVTEDRDAGLTVKLDFDPRTITVPHFNAWAYCSRHKDARPLLPPAKES